MTQDDGSDIHGQVSTGESTTGRHTLISLAEARGEAPSVTQTGRFVRALRWATQWKVLLPFLVALLGGASTALGWVWNARLNAHDEKAHAPLIQRLDGIEKRNITSDLTQARIEQKVDDILRFMPRAHVAAAQRTETP